MFWKKVTQQVDQMGINEPRLPRKRRAPHRFDDHSSTEYSPVTPEDHYRAIYLEALDTVTSCISESFEQEAYQMYKNLEQLLLKGDQGEEADALLALYSDDFDRDAFQAQLHTSSYQLQD